MTTDSTTHDRVALALSGRYNRQSLLPLIESMGGLHAFFNDSESVFTRKAGTLNLPLPDTPREQWLEKAEKEISVMSREGIYCCSWEDDIYPPLLHHCPDAPLVLFYKGHLQPTPSPAWAIVGTRKASVRCKTLIDKWIGEIIAARYLPEIISGLAYGIDIAAHQAALHHGLVTKAVFGHGLHTVYPASHRAMARKILDSGGCLISEFPTCTPVLPVHFLQRNRIIAGMSHSVLIAESALRGGAMATARQAFSYDRLVMAIPGRPEDTYSAGCNRLIKENIACMVESSDDLLNQWGWSKPPQKGEQILLPFFEKSEEEQRILEVLQAGESDIDHLCRLTGIPLNNLHALLLRLELNGRLLTLPGNLLTLTK